MSVFKSPPRHPALLSLPLIVICGSLYAAQHETSAAPGPCPEDTAVTIDELYANWGIPGDCSAPQPSARTCRVAGYVSRANIWDRRRRPWLPESKFLLQNAAGTLTLEVQVGPAATPSVFAILASQATTWDGAVELTGALAAIDLPIMSACRRALVIRVTGADSLAIGGNRSARDATH